MNGLKPVPIDGCFREIVFGIVWENGCDSKDHVGINGIDISVQKVNVDHVCVFSGETLSRFGTLTRLMAVKFSLADLRDNAY